MTDDRTVMLSCRVPERLRRQLKLAALTSNERMSEIVTRAIDNELSRLQEKE